MADVLSQGEIDALLSALSSGEIAPEELTKEEEKHKVKKYDFRSPQKFSKEHIRSLESIHDNYARIISSYLTAQLRNTVKVKIESVEQTTYEEFIHSIPSSTVLTIFKMQPLNGNILFETNPQFVFQITDILLGGDGSGRYKEREFTDIDKNIITRVNEGLISNLKLAWSDVLEVNPEIEAVETNPALNQTLAPHEPVALITFSVEVSQSTSLINMCIPYLSIEKFLENLSIRYWYQEDDDDLKMMNRQLIKKSLDAVKVPVIAKLGMTSITVDDFLKLAVGDIVTLKETYDSPMKVIVEDKEYFTGKPGVLGKKLGVQIIDIIDKDVDKYD